jgi:hypothetical protein
MSRRDCIGWPGAIRRNANGADRGNRQGGGRDRLPLRQWRSALSFRLAIEASLDQSNQITVRKSASRCAAAINGGQPAASGDPSGN